MNQPYYSSDTRAGLESGCGLLAMIVTGLALLALGVFVISLL